MLLDAERLLLRMGDEYQFLNKTTGLLRYLSLPNKPERHVRRFLDILAESRDELWQEYRVERNPLVADLEVPWPRGLPIQDLVPHKLSYWKDMPYIESRAEGVLFAQRRILRSPIPMQAEEREAIGSFVDDFIFSLQVFVSAVAESSERESRALQVWNHAVADLTREHMSKNQALWYWKHVFSLAPNVKLPHAVTSSFEVSYFKLPEHNHSGVVELNPNMELGQFSLPSTVVYPLGKLPESCLDCMLMINKMRTRKTIHSPFQFRNTETIQTMSTPSIWDVWSSGGSIPPEGADYVIAITISFLDAVYGSNFSLFKQPFPSKTERRIPAFRLSEEFLKDEGNIGKLSLALRTLERLSPYVPATLFQGLGRSIWKRLHAEEKEDSEVLKAAIGVVRIVLHGDHPDAAYEFLIRSILKDPEGSLWRNCFLNTGILRHLPKYAIEDLLDSICCAIINKLRMQQRAIKLRARRNGSPIPPLVTIATIRLVTRLLCETNYVNQMFACKCLASLLKNSTDADARIVLVEGLLSIKSTMTREEVLLAVISILEEHVIPIAASINERQPPTESEWTKAEVEDGPLPNVYENNTTFDLAPMLKLLVEAIPPTSTGKDSVNQMLHSIWMKRIIIPTLKRSASNHRRWIALFLKRNKFALSIDRLPTVPSNPKVLADVFKAYPTSFPKSASLISTFETIENVVKINISPDIDIALINEAIRNDADICFSNAGKHWLSVWSTTGDPFNLGVYQFADLMFDRAMNSSSEPLGGATIKLIHSFMQDVAWGFLFTSGTAYYNTAIDKISFHKRICCSETHEFFLSNCIPLLEDLIEFIYYLQRHGESREPWDVPEVLPIKLEILKGKHWHETSKPPLAADIRSFAKDVISLFEIVLDNKHAYERNWTLLKQVALQQFHKKLFAPLAVEFLSLSRNMTEDRAEDYLRLKLIEELLSEAEDPEEEALIQPLVENLGAYLKIWRADPEESIRMRVESIIEILWGR
ncbi:hypothetical protein F4805DRAFT_150685 [Annulohypoxylon moriforme]|nr:hypothetical protein F4805DRAFT_150685 [Annulohypoxylon moriforme]